MGFCLGFSIVHWNCCATVYLLLLLIFVHVFCNWLYFHYSQFIRQSPTTWLQYLFVQCVLHVPHHIFVLPWLSHWQLHSWWEGSEPVFHSPFIIIPLSLIITIIMTNCQGYHYVSVARWHPNRWADWLDSRIERFHLSGFCTWRGHKLCPANKEPQWWTTLWDIPSPWNPKMRTWWWCSKNHLPHGPNIFLMLLY